MNDKKKTLVGLGTMYLLGCCVGLLTAYTLGLNVTVTTTLKEVA